MHPIPETETTLAAQMDWLKQGKRRAVLVTPGATLPYITSKFRACYVNQGLVIYNPTLLSEEAIRQEACADRLGKLLGYGIEAKPEAAEAVGVVTVRDPNGSEKQAVATDSRRLDSVVAAAHQVKDPGDRVALESPDPIAAERLLDLTRRELRIRPFDPERDTRALLEAVTRTGHSPVLFPTHLVTTGDGRIVGCFAFNSLPLFRLWLDRDQVRAADTLKLLFFVENTYRAQGAAVVATLVDDGSPFGQVSARLGYLPAPSTLHLYTKGL